MHQQGKRTTGLYDYQQKLTRFQCPILFVSGNPDPRSWSWILTLNSPFMFVPVVCCCGCPYPIQVGASALRGGVEETYSNAPLASRSAVCLLPRGARPSFGTAGYGSGRVGRERCPWGRPRWCPWGVGRESPGGTDRYRASRGPQYGRVGDLAKRTARYVPGVRTTFL